MAELRVNMDLVRSENNNFSKSVQGIDRIVSMLNHTRNSAPQNVLEKRDCQYRLAKVSSNLASAHNHLNDIVNMANQGMVQYEEMEKRLRKEDDNLNAIIAGGSAVKKTTGGSNNFIVSFFAEIGSLIDKIGAEIIRLLRGIDYIGGAIGFVSDSFDILRGKESPEEKITINKVIGDMFDAISGIFMWAASGKTLKQIFMELISPTVTMPVGRPPVVSWTKKLGYSFKSGLKTTVGSAKYFFRSATSTALSIVGAIMAIISNVFMYREKYKDAEVDKTEKIVVGTTIKTGLDFGVIAGVTAGVSAAVAGVVAAVTTAPVTVPILVVTAITGIVVYAINYISRCASGKDLTELITDGIMGLIYGEEDAAKTKKNEITGGNDSVVTLSANLPYPTWDYTKVVAY